MAKLSLTDLANLSNETTVVAAINANNTSIETAVENTLSRDGTTPNQMEASLDMNSNRIINLPEPATGSEPLRLTDANTLIGGGTISTNPSGGSSGDLLAKASATDYDVEWVTPESLPISTDTQAALDLKLDIDDVVASVITSGADATGVADSSAAFAAALALSTAVVVPPGIYKLASPWVLAANSDIHFVGNPTLNFTAGTGVGISITGSNVKLRGKAILDGQLSTDSYLNGHTAIQTSGSDATTTYDDIAIDELTIINWGDSGVRTSYTTGLSITRNKISRIGRSAILSLSPIAARVNFNKIENVTPGSGGIAPYLNAYGITFTRTATDSLVTNPRPEDCEAVGNDIDGVPTWEGLDTHGGQNIRFLYNNVQNCLVGIAVVPSNGPAPTYISALDVLIQGNTIDGANAAGPGRSNGIFMSPASAAAGVTSVMRAVGNTLRNCGTNDPAYFTAGAAIYCSMTNSPLIADNLISNSKWSAINLENILTDAVVTGNQIIGVNVIAGNQTGIRASSTTISGLISNNAFDGAFDGIHVTTAPAAGYGLRVSDTNTYVGGQAFKSTYASNTFSNADYTMRREDRFIPQIGTMSAARTITLLPANSFAPGTRIILADRSATASATLTISIAPDGSDLINGSNTTQVAIASSLGFSELISDGVSNWLLLAERGGSSILSAANGGTGVANAYTITLVGSNLSVTPRVSGQWPVWSAGSLTGGTSTTLTNAAAPSSPSAGSVTIWNDSTDLRFHDKNSAGTIGTTVIADTGASNNFLTAISAAGVVSKAQPAFTNISGTATVAQGGTGQTTEAEAVGELIQALTEDTTPDWSADFIGAYDASADTGKKIKLSTVSREILTANRTYYVRTDGNDSNTGLADTAGGAFLTIQQAVNTAASLDLGLYYVVIQVRTGTYTSTVTTKPYVGTGPIYIRGDTTTPSNCVISTTSSTAFRFTNKDALYVVEGFQVSTTTSGFSFYATGSDLQYGSMIFGATPAGVAHIYLNGQSNITATGNYEITGGPYAHIQADYGSTATISSRTITVTGTPAFSAGFIYATRGAIVAAVSDTFSGSATGPYYFVNKNAVIDTGGGATYFPGNSAGSSATGGQYV